MKFRVKNQKSHRGRVILKIGAPTTVERKSAKKKKNSRQEKSAERFAKKTEIEKKKKVGTLSAESTLKRKL